MPGTNTRAHMTNGKDIWRMFICEDGRDKVVVCLRVRGDMSTSVCCMECMVSRFRVSDSERISGGIQRFVGSPQPGSCLTRSWGFGLRGAICVTSGTCDRWLLVLNAEPSRHSQPERSFGACYCKFGLSMSLAAAWIRTALS